MIRCIPRTIIHNAPHITHIFIVTIQSVRKVNEEHVRYCFVSWLLHSTFAQPRIFPSVNAQNFVPLQYEISFLKVGNAEHSNSIGTLRMPSYCFLFETHFGMEKLTLQHTHFSCQLTHFHTHYHSGIPNILCKMDRHYLKRKKKFQEMFGINTLKRTLQYSPYSLRQTLS